MNCLEMLTKRARNEWVFVAESFLCFGFVVILGSSFFLRTIATHVHLIIGCNSLFQSGIITFQLVTLVLQSCIPPFQLVVLLFQLLQSFLELFGFSVDIVVVVATAVVIITS